jgi:hypothetical protein
MQRSVALYFPSPWWRPRATIFACRLLRRCSGPVPLPRREPLVNNLPHKITETAAALCRHIMQRGYPVAGYVDIQPTHTLPFWEWWPAPAAFLGLHLPNPSDHTNGADTLPAPDLPCTDYFLLNWTMLSGFLLSFGGSVRVAGVFRTWIFKLSSSSRRFRAISSRSRCMR